MKVVLFASAMLVATGNALSVSLKQREPETPMRHHHDNGLATLLAQIASY